MFAKCLTGYFTKLMLNIVSQLPAFYSCGMIYSFEYAEIPNFHFICRHQAMCEELQNRKQEILCGG